MKNILIMTALILAMLAWATAQQPGSTPGPGSGPAGSQAPGATQTPPTMPPDSAAPGPQSGMTSAPVTEGCLGGSAPNYTITDKSGTTYKLNIPPGADASKLAQHIGEPVNVSGNVNGKSSIDVQGIGKGSGTCPNSGKSGVQPPK